MLPCSCVKTIEWIVRGSGVVVHVCKGGAVSRLGRSIECCSQKSLSISLQWVKLAKGSHVESE